MAIHSPEAPGAPGDRHDRRNPRRGVSVPNRAPLSPASLPAKQTDAPADFGTMTTQEAVLADEQIQADRATDVFPRRAFQKRKGFTVGGLIRNAVLATTVAGGIIGIVNAPKIVDWTQQQFNATTTHDTSDGGKYNLPVPSGRSIETPAPNEKPITAEQLPHIKQITFSEITAFPGYKSNIGLDAYPEGDKKAEVQIDPIMAISGYLVEKIKNADGSFDFFVEVPYLDGSDILNKSTTSTTPVYTETIGNKNFDPKNNYIKEDVAGGFIIDLKLFPGDHSNFYPFTSSISYGESEFKRINGLAETGTGPDALFDYIKDGDPIRAAVDIGDNFSNTTTQDLQDYASAGHASNLADAQAQMKTILEQNIKTLNKLKADNGKTISIADQLSGRYPITPRRVAFLP